MCPLRCSSLGCAAALTTRSASEWAFSRSDGRTRSHCVWFSACRGGRARHHLVAAVCADMCPLSALSWSSSLLLALLCVVVLWTQCAGVSYYTDRWAVQIRGGERVARRLAAHHGFQFIAKVITLFTLSLLTFLGRPERYFSAVLCFTTDVSFFSATSPRWLTLLVLSRIFNLLLVPLLLLTAPGDFTLDSAPNF